MPTLTRKSQVTVPKRIRTHLGIQPGDAIEFTVENEKVVVIRQKKEQTLSKYKGLLGKGRTKQVMDDLR